MYKHSHNSQAECQPSYPDIQQTKRSLIKHENNKHNTHRQVDRIDNATALMKLTDSKTCRLCTEQFEN